jgi:hypothetical protein
MSDRSEEDFRNILKAWHNNNGIQGFADYFEWGGYSGIYKHLAKETGKSVRNLILADFSSSILPVGQTNRFRDDYVNEWWYVWQSRSLSDVYFRSDGSIYHWLLYVCNPDGVGKQE